MHRFSFALLATQATAALLRRQSSSVGTATVNLAQTHGEAQFRTSNFIYGFPDNGTSADTSIPSYLLNDIKFNACRAGGAQIAAGGWKDSGYETYLPRFESTLSNYRTTVQLYGGEFILLIHDLWGADGGATNETRFPGDNGDWTEMETFLGQVVTDINENNMLDNLILDIWNEPDGSGFWSKSWDQYLEYYNRATLYLRDALPTTPVSGPSMAEPANTDNSNWQTWVSSVSQADTVPDHYSWHQLTTTQTVDESVVMFDEMRTANNLPVKRIDVNEYGGLDNEQRPAVSAWYIAQLERYDMVGLRANWGGGEDLHNWMGNLVYSDDGGQTYFPNGEWRVYEYYAGMTGQRAVTAASEDAAFDVFATVGSNEDGKAVVKALAGIRQAEGTYDITLSGMTTLGLPAEGSVEVRRRQFQWGGDVYTEAAGPVDLGVAVYNYTSDALTISTDTDSAGDATFVYEFYGA